MKRKSNSCLAPVTLVVADCENVGNFRKYRHVVTRFVQQLSSKTWMQAYHHWRNVSGRKQKQFQALGWMCVDVASRAHNALDELLIQDCQHLVNCLLPQTVVLIAGDQDFAPLVRDLQRREIRVVVIGRRGQIHHKLRTLVPHDTYAIEDLAHLDSQATA
jgi:hypothetical protein